MVAAAALEVAAASNLTTLPPPPCDVDRMGSLPGRWVRPGALRKDATFVGLGEWPFVWVPYECAPPAWPGPAAVAACTRAADMLFVGLSRERTNFFDVHDLANETGIEYVKYMSEAQLGNTFYSSVYWSEPAEWREWNVPNGAPAAAPKLDRIRAELFSDIDKTTMCNRTPPAAHVPASPPRPSFVVASIEEFWLAQAGLRARWPAILARFVQLVREACPSATVLYKTSRPRRARSNSRAFAPPSATTRRRGSRRRWRARRAWPSWTRSR